MRFGNVRRGCGGRKAWQGDRGEGALLSMRGTSVKPSLCINYITSPTGK